MRAPARGALGLRDERARELRRYRHICRLIDRRLDQGRLSEARQLSVEARSLFKRLYGENSQDKSGRAPSNGGR
ncbi:MAG: hypothetical protein M3018_03545 [Actinomycetota bacterium]|nr:hypothetical protein [Actinomycetota bacterium]